MSQFWNIEALPQDLPALILPGKSTISYGELTRLADGWRENLLALADGRRLIVAVEFNVSVDAVAAYVGALRAGLPVLVIEPGQLGAGTQIRTRWNPGIIVAEQNGRFEAQLGDAEGAGADREPPHADLRLLLSTSGSTGDPKLVRLSGENIASNAASIAEYLDLSATDRAMTTLPFFYSYGLSVLNSYLHVGAALVLTERSVVDPAFWDEFREAEATSMALVPHQFDLLERSGFSELDLPSLRYVTQAGGKLAKPSVLRFAEWAETGGWELVVMYGQTEASPRISYVPPKLLKQAPESIGCAIPGGRLWLCDEDGKEVSATGVAGELVYEGPNVMMGYAEQWPDLARGAEVHELRTGDIAERTADGLFRIVGRLKRFVKLFGLRISLDQVEALLRGRGITAHALEVQEQLVVLHREQDDGARVRDIVCAEYELPTSAIHTAHLAETPLLASGKTDQRALQQVALRVLEEAQAHSQTHQQSIAAVFADATRRQSVSPQDSFASLGGDSLSYLNVQMALEARLGTAPEGWENMPVSVLEAMEPTAAQPTRRAIGVDVLLRLFALTIIIAQHASDYNLYGGTWILITVMGYSTARFQLKLLSDGKVLRFVKGMLYPIVPIYLAILTAYALLRDEVPLSQFVMLGNYETWKEGSLLQVYWFVSFYVQIVLLCALVAATPPLRRWMARTPWAFAATLLVPALVLQLVQFAADGMLQDPYAPWPWNHLASHGLIECLPIFLLGWMVQKASTRWEKLLTVLAAAWVVADFYVVVHWLSIASLLVAAIVLLALNPKIVLPSRAVVFLQRAGTATLFVYLLHEIVVWIVQRKTESQELAIVLSIIGAFIVAMTVKWAFDLVERRALQLWYRVKAAGKPDHGSAPLGRELSMTSPEAL